MLNSLRNALLLLFLGAGTCVIATLVAVLTDSLIADQDGPPDYYAAFYWRSEMLMALVVGGLLIRVVGAAWVVCVLAAKAFSTKAPEVG